ncbi:MAG: hypothetical protein R3F20_00915 [Planctomycetota bacterium]
MRNDVRREIEKAMRRGSLTVKEGKDFLRTFVDGMNGYTYLEG